MRSLGGIIGRFAGSSRGRGRSSTAGAPARAERRAKPRRPKAVDLTHPNRALATARIAAILFIGATVIYGIAIGGYADQLLDYARNQVQVATVRSGFTVKHLEIEGQKQAGRDDIIKALGLGQGTPIFSVDSAAAKARLEQLPWVHRAKVMRLLPSTLHIMIEEREPFAVWQIKGKMRLIDAEGRVIAPVARRDYSELPLVVGEGASDKVRELFALLGAHETLKPRVLAVIRVADRRWTLKLKNGTEIKLPEERIGPALERLAELESTRGVLSAEVISIDLRLGDRISIRLSERAASGRNAAQPKGQDS